MNRDTENFLEALLWAHNWDDCTLEEGYFTIYDFEPDFVQSVEDFLLGFDCYLERKNEGDETEETREAIEAANNCPLSFGGSVYFSLSGHGVGFWDESEPWGQIIQDHLEAYAGSRYTFEQADFWKDETSDCLRVEGIQWPPLKFAIVSDITGKYLSHLFEDSHAMKFQAVEPVQGKAYFYDNPKTARQAAAKEGGSLHPMRKEKNQ